MEERTCLLASEEDLVILGFYSTVYSLIMKLRDHILNNEKKESIKWNWAKDIDSQSPA